MRIVKNRNKYEVYDNTLEVFDTLPIQTYVVRFTQMKGFYLELFTNIEVREDKIYGIHESKVNKVLRTFQDPNYVKNLGVILSGNKGIGKSLCAKMIAAKSLELGFPVIVVDTYYPEIASFLGTIDQNVIILFDEFDKTFGTVYQNKDTDEDPQVEMLTLFDGVVGGNKKLFVITCNNVNKLNDYLVNRPGRFHYHYRFDYPSTEEIREYLLDKLGDKFNGEINKVISFSRKVSLNYDCLNSIAYELLSGESFEEVIKDLNIINVEKELYNVFLHFKNGLPHSAHNVELDFFSSSDDTEMIYLYDKMGNNFIDVTFSYNDCSFNELTGVICVEKDKLHIDCVDEDKKEFVEQLEIDYLEIKRAKQKSYHYNLL